MVGKTALITGITGQDGYYLSRLLLGKRYQVYGLQQHSPYLPPNEIADGVELRYGDMTDAAGLVRLVAEVHPDEIYNLAAQSDVAASFTIPEYTANVNALGFLRLLEAVRLNNPASRIYQAGTSELFGNAPAPQGEASSGFEPRSPYATSKLFAHHIGVNYRDAYGMFVSNGILFNHESPHRGHVFVTRKVTRGLARIKLGMEDCLYLGNLDARRDWGHARDYVRAQWLILQQPEPGDYVIATGTQRSVRDCVDVAAGALGMSLRWLGEGLDEVAVDEATGRVVVAVDPAFFRPAETHSLVGDASIARAKLGWEPTITFEETIQEMADHDYRLALQEARKHEL